MQTTKATGPQRTYVTTPTTPQAESEQAVEAICNTARQVLQYLNSGRPRANLTLHHVRELAQFVLASHAATDKSTVLHTGDQDVDTATLLGEAAELLTDYALHQRNLGKDSFAAGADAHAYRLRRLST